MEIIDAAENKKYIEEIKLSINSSSGDFVDIKDLDDALKKNGCDLLMNKQILHNSENSIAFKCMGPYTLLTRNFNIPIVKKKIIIKTREINWKYHDIMEEALNSNKSKKQSNRGNERTIKEAITLVSMRNNIKEGAELPLKRKHSERIIKADSKKSEKKKGKIKKIAEEEGKEVKIGTEELKKKEKETR